MVRVEGGKSRVNVAVLPKPASVDADGGGGGVRVFVQKKRGAPKRKPRERNEENVIDEGREGTKKSIAKDLDLGINIDTKA